MSSRSVRSRISIPDVYEHLSTSRVLVMEWLDGASVRDVAWGDARSAERTKIADFRAVGPGQRAGDAVLAAGGGVDQVADRIDKSWAVGTGIVVVVEAVDARGGLGDKGAAVQGDLGPADAAVGAVALGGEGKTSLVAKWAAELAHNDWPGCEAAFAWSFYSQGTSDQTQASSDSSSQAFEA